MLLECSFRWYARLLLPMVAAIALPLAAGCKPQEQITRYTVKKEHLINTASATSNTPSATPAQASPKRILGAIILTTDAGWFFKVTDAPELVAPHSEAFVTFVKALRFGSGPAAEPQWTLPEGWKQLPASGFRFATIHMASADLAGAASKPVEISVSRLGKVGVDDTEYLLTNINRWRGQVQLPPLTADELAKNSVRTKVDGRDCTLVDMTGVEAGGGSMPFAPFAGGAAPPLSGAGRESRPAPEPTSTVKSGLKFDKPEGWTEGASNQFRKASFVAGDGARKAEITVIDLGAEGNDWLTNVNRWRGQVGLKPTSAAELEKETKAVEVGTSKGQYAELVGPTETILGVMAVQGSKAWFIKLKGDKQLAEREKAKFEQFVKSLQLE